MRYAMVLVFAAGFLAGCGGDTDKKQSIDQPSSVNLGTSSEISETDLKTLVVGIGDIESTMRLSVSLDESSYSSVASHTEEINKIEIMSRASADVASPYPLELNVLLECRNQKNYPGHAFRGTVQLYNGNEIIDTFKFVAGATAMLDVQRRVVNVARLIDVETGGSVLLHARCEIEFFLDTDESTIDLDSPAPAGTTRVTKMGNPLRITFLP
jgi:hypothetical protein